MLKLMNIPFLLMPQLALTVALAYVPVILYLLACRRWPQRRLMLQLISLSALGIMSLNLFGMAGSAFAYTVECANPADGWMAFFSGPIHLRDIILFIGFPNWLIKSLSRDVIPTALCMLIIFGSPKSRKWPYHAKGLLLTGLLPVMWIVLMVVLFVLLLVLNILADMLGYAHSLWQETLFRLN